MQPPLATLDVFEMFHRIGDIGGAAVDPGLLKMQIEQLARWPYERAAFLVLLLSRLLADDHESSILRTFPHHGIVIELSNGAFATSMDRLADRRHRIGSFRELQRAFLDHLRLPRLRVCDQLGNEDRLRHVLPVFFRHLPEHRADLQPCGIEDGGIVFAPEILHRISAGRIGPLRRWPFGHGCTIPVKAPSRCQDRPAHVGKAAHEEARICAQNVMFGFEPGDVVIASLPLFAFNEPEPDERAHLVAVAPYFLRKLLHPPHIEIGLVLHDPGVALQSPQQTIKQRKTSGVGVKYCVAGEFHEVLAGAYRTRILRRQRQAWLTMREKIGATARLDPGDAVMRDPALYQRARPLAPEVEIVGFG